MSNKKISRIKGAENDSADTSSTWQPTAESAGKAKTNRIIAVVLWVMAFAVQIGVIFKLREVPVSMAWIIGLIVAQLILVVIANVLWKKANRLDPASEKNKFKFFVQNQLGLILSVLAFLPLVVLILTNKNLTGKQKGILGSIAGAALVLSGIVGTDFNPASIEQYTEQTERVKELNNGNNFVYWTSLVRVTTSLMIVDISTLIERRRYSKGQWLKHENSKVSLISAIDARDKPVKNRSEERRIVIRMALSVVILHTH